MPAEDAIRVLQLKSDQLARGSPHTSPFLLHRSLLILWSKHCSATTGSIGFNGPLNYADDGNLVSVCFVGGEGKTVSPNA